MTLRGLVNTTLKTTAVVGAVGAACVAYAAAVEVRWFTLRRVTVPVLPEGSEPLRVLHLSDLHLMPTQERKINWVNDLAALEPDLIVNTGDNISHERAVQPLLRAYGDLFDLSGVFVTTGSRTSRTRASTCSPRTSSGTSRTARTCRTRRCAARSPAPAGPT